MMTQKNILFFGTPEIAVPSLEALIADETVHIVGVGTPPDKPVGRKQILTPCPVKKYAEDYDLPIFEIGNKADVVKVFQENEVDLAIVIAFGVIFPEEILNLPRLGTVNVHFSLLPQYRGASPVQSAILNGDTVSGITFQKMVKKLDAGDTLWQKPSPIENKKTSELWDFFARETAKEMPHFLEAYFDKKIVPEPQKEEEATFCHKFEKADGLVDPKSETAEMIYRKYLAFDVWPKIFMETDKGPMKLTEISLEEKAGVYPLFCEENTKLYISKAQLAGKKEMSIGDILRGNSGLLNISSKVSHN